MGELVDNICNDHEYRISQENKIEISTKLFFEVNGLY